MLLLTCQGIRNHILEFLMVRKCPYFEEKWRGIEFFIHHPSSLSSFEYFSFTFVPFAKRIIILISFPFTAASKIFPSKSGAFFDFHFPFTKPSYSSILLYSSSVRLFFKISTCFIRIRNKDECV